MSLQGKKVAIFVEELFDVFEFWYPYYRLKEAGADVVVVGSGRKFSFQGKSGTEITVDAAIEEVDVAEFSALIIPGGYAPDMMRRFPAMVDFVRECDRQGKIIAAICHAGWMLASAGVLEKRRVTSFYAIKDDLINAGADWIDEAVVVDGNLVTSRTPADLPRFMPAVIEAIAS